MEAPPRRPHVGGPRARPRPLCQHHLCGVDREGHADTCDRKIRTDLHDAGFTDLPASQEEADLPSWWGDEAVHRSHRSSLLRKDPEHYRSRFEPGLPDDLEYVWPVQVEKPTN
jgi:hypothetical protein